MTQLQVAVYARVSCGQQVEAGTIESQLAVLRDRVEYDGLKLSQELTFIRIPGQALYTFAMRPPTSIPKTGRCNPNRDLHFHTKQYIFSMTRHQTRRTCASIVFFHP